jgi:hypothetical protein
MSQNYRVIVSLTTISSRLTHLQEVISSLLDQTYPNTGYSIRLYLSRESFLLDSGCTLVPEYITRLIQSSGDRVTIHFTHNIGSYRKLIPCLTELYEAGSSAINNTIIVTADDDTIYPRDWLQTLVSYYEQERCIIAFRGRTMTFSHRAVSPYKTWCKTLDLRKSLANVPTGKDGVLYSAMLLHPAVLNHSLALTTAPKADDLWFKCHSLLLGVPCYIINTSLDDALPSVAVSPAAPSLYSRYNKLGGNDTAIAMLESYLMTEYSIDMFSLVHEPESCMQLLLSSIKQSLLRRFV